MTTVTVRPVPVRRARLARAAQFVTLAACLSTLSVAGYGLATWTQLPEFPTPAANASLLLLRQAITVVLVVTGAALLPFAAGARSLRILGAGAAVLAALAHVFAAQAYRDLAWAPALGGVAGLCALAALLLVAASLAPGGRR